MASIAQWQQKLQRALQEPDSLGVRPKRLLDDAQRLWARVRRLLAMDLAPPDADRPAMELACLAIQLPMRETRVQATGRTERTNFRDRAQFASELLLGLADEQDEDDIIASVSRILIQLPQKQPVLPEARVLADAINLEEFGATGLAVAAVQMSRAGDGLSAIVESFTKRDAYGYWDIQLKNAFHFEPVRQIARRRLAATRQAVQLLKTELDEDAGS